MTRFRRQGMMKNRRWFRVVVFFFTLLMFIAKMTRFLHAGKKLRRVWGDTIFFLFFDNYYPFVRMSFFSFKGGIWYSKTFWMHNEANKIHTFSISIPMENLDMEIILPCESLFTHISLTMFFFFRGVDGVCFFFGIFKCKFLFLPVKLGVQRYLFV